MSRCHGPQVRGVSFPGAFCPLLCYCRVGPPIPVIGAFVRGLLPARVQNAHVVVFSLADWRTSFVPLMAMLLCGAFAPMHGSVSFCFCFPISFLFFFWGGNCFRCVCHTAFEPRGQAPPHMALRAHCESDGIVSQ